MAKTKPKRLLVISDLHCGHLVGLTPPDYWTVETETNSAQAEIAKHQRELWRWYAKTIDSLKPVDFVVVNGDAIDGKGLRSGSTEAIKAARNEQCKMAAYCIDYIGAKEVGLIHGTAYHDGGDEDWCHVIASFMDTPVMFTSGHKFFGLEGWVWDFKHKIGRSSIPHGQATPLKRAKVWNLIWNSRGEQQPKADFLVRSHVHYFCEDYDAVTRCRGFITPALQGYGSKYGVRECENTVDIGMICFDVVKENVECSELLAEGLSQQSCRVISR
jgi:hypothetical protein